MTARKASELIAKYQLGDCDDLTTEEVRKIVDIQVSQARSDMRESYGAQITEAQIKVEDAARAQREELLQRVNSLEAGGILPEFYKTLEKIDLALDNLNTQQAKQEKDA